MTTQRKADSRAESLGQVADLRARVLALMPVRDAAVSVAILLARGIQPHPAILDRLQAALRASHWTVRKPLPAQAHPRKVPPRERRADRSTGGGPRSQHKSEPALLSSPAAQRGHYGRPPAPATVVVLAARGCYGGAMTEAKDLRAGRELDALVAEKVMGWTVSVHDSDPPHYSAVDPSTNTYHGPLPEFSTDIAAAWTVVEKLRALGFGVVMDNLPSASGKDVGWTVSVVGISTQDAFMAIAGTAPIAICRAALKAVEGKP